MFTYLYEDYLDSKVNAIDFMDRGVSMIYFSETKFKKSSLNDVMVMIDNQLINSTNTFSDSHLFVEEIYQNKNRYDDFISQMSKIDETRKVEKNKVKALLNSYDILLKNAITKVDSEMFYDVIYTMLYEVPSILMEVSDISIQQSAVKCNENDSKNQRIQIKDPLEKGSLFFLIHVVIFQYKDFGGVMKYTLEELVLHPIQLVNVQLIDMQLKKHIYINDLGDLHRDITISTKSELIDENSGFADVLVEINTTLNEEPYYDLSITYRGICENHGDFLEADELEYFLDMQAIKLIWPYFRELLPGLMMKMGTECFDIPTIDVLKTVASRIGNE